MTAAGNRGVGDPVDAADEGVHARAVFMVHLRVLARLGEGVGLVDQQDDAAPRLARLALQLAGLVDRVVERRRQELRHFPDAALPACGQAERQQRQFDILLPRDGVADGLGQFGLAGADIAGEDHQRRTAQHRRRAARSSSGDAWRAHVSSPAGLTSSARIFVSLAFWSSSPTSRASRSRASKSG